MLRAAHFYLKQGFVFLDEWEPLESHPHITLQTMRLDRRLRGFGPGPGIHVTEKHPAVVRR